MKSLSLSQPYLLITVGIPGSGKSLFAEKFAATFHTPYVHYDTIMDISGRNSDTSDVFAGYMLRELFRTKHAIMFDGPTATRAERTALKDLATSAGYIPLFVWVQTDKDTAKDRYLKTGRKNGRRVSGAQFDTLVAAFTPPIAKEHPTVVISGKHTYATQAKAVLMNIAQAKQSARTKMTRSPSTIAANGKRNITVR